MGTKKMDQSISKIYFARHGERQGFYKTNDYIHKCVKDTSRVGDDPLTEMGKEQAWVLGKQLPYLEKVICSPFKRCIETASIVASIHGVPLYVDNSLCEVLKQEYFK